MSRLTRRSAALAGGAALSVVLALAPAAMAETYEVGPFPTTYYPLLGVGTNGGDTTADYAVTHGGCAGNLNASLAVAVGESNRQCTSHYRWHDAGSEAAAWNLAVGLGGADASSYTLAVSDHGDASGQCWTTGTWTDCQMPAAAVTGTGSAWGAIAVSGTGSATSSYDDSGYQATREGVAVSGTGPASADNPNGVVVSGTGVATGNTVAVSGIHTAQARGCGGDPVENATSGHAVSVTGNAYGCNPVSVTGKAVKT